MMSEPIELKPCPRCGGKAVPDDDILGQIGSGIHCDDCGYWTGEDMQRDEAIEWWNTQPLIDGLKARIAELEAKHQHLEKRYRDLVQKYDDLEQENERLEAELAETDPAALAEAYLKGVADEAERWRRGIES